MLSDPSIKKKSMCDLQIVVFSPLKVKFIVNKLLFSVNRYSNQFNGEPTYEVHTYTWRVTLNLIHSLFKK